MKKPKKFSIINLYSESWKYIQSCKTQIYWIISLFFVFAIIGFLIPMPKEAMNLILEYIKQILAQTEGMSTSQLISFIFLNNLQASFIGLAFGIFFGVIPLFLIIMNGYILGFVSFLTVDKGSVLSLLSLFPHGIFELPAVFISLGMGLKLGTFLFQKNKRKFFEKNFSNSLRVFIFVIIPLLAIAAVIEGSLIFLMK